MNKVWRICKATLAPLKWHHLSTCLTSACISISDPFDLSHTCLFLWFSTDSWVNASLCKYIIVKFAYGNKKSSPNPIGGDFKGSKLLTAENHSVNWTQASSALLGFLFFFFFFFPQQQSSCVLVTENLSWHYESSFSHCSADTTLNSILAQAGGKQAWAARESQDADALKQSISQTASEETSSCFTPVEVILPFLSLPQESLNTLCVLCQSRIKIIF